MKHRVCFIDDDGEFEIPIFLDVFGGAYDVIAATSYGRLQEESESRGDWRPELFVLDLYFPSGKPDQAAVDALRARPLRLGDDRAEIRAAYENSVRTRQRLGEVLSAWRQGPEGGLKLAQQVAADFPDVPIVFYSRKATAEDIICCLAAPNVVAVERKPTGSDDADTRRRTHVEAPRLVERFRQALSAKHTEEGRRLKGAAALIADYLRRQP